MNRPKINIFTFLILSILLIIAYLFNAEKFFPEYWLQNKFDNHRIEKMNNLTLSETTLDYQLVYNEEIDILITLYSNGIISISRNKGNNQKHLRTTYFISDSVEI